MTDSPMAASRTLFRYGFYVSLLFYFYGTLFPFRFDFSIGEISGAWAKAGVLPYWDVERGRIPSVPDSVANVLLTFPLGFLGFLHRTGSGRSAKIWKWCALGLALGLAAEILQLALPSRSSNITDVLNNGLGTCVGAALARRIGPHVRGFLDGTAFDRESSYLWLLAGTLAVFMFAPFDFSLDVSQIISDYRMLRGNPWESGVPIETGWLQTAGFALVGGLAGRMSRTRRLMGLTRAQAACAVILVLPIALEFSQLFVASHAPSLRDLSMEIAGAAAGWTAGLFVPALARPFLAFAVLNLAIIAAGLSPYHFAAWQTKATFQWIPFLEYYDRTTAASLADAMTGVTEFGLLAGLLMLSCPKCTRWWATGYVVAVAAGIECAQLFIPYRYANITDILVAGLGAWTGGLIIAGIESSARKRAGRVEAAIRIQTRAPL